VGRKPASPAARGGVGTAVLGALFVTILSNGMNLTRIDGLRADGRARRHRHHRRAARFACGWSGA